MDRLPSKSRRLSDIAVWRDRVEERALRHQP
jgi:hypothetical protein